MKDISSELAMPGEDSANFLHRLRCTDRDRQTVIFVTIFLVMTTILGGAEFAQRRRWHR